MKTGSIDCDTLPQWLRCFEISGFKSFGPGFKQGGDSRQLTCFIHLPSGQCCKSHVNACE